MYTHELANMCKHEILTCTSDIHIYGRKGERETRKKKGERLEETETLRFRGISFFIKPDLQELGSVFHIESHLPSSTQSNFASAVSLFFNSISSDLH